MYLPLEFFEELRDKLDIAEEIASKVKLRKQGRGEFSGLCPFHSERTPSFTVNNSKNFYHCFGCGAHGDVIKFHSQITGISYKEAAMKLADKYGISLPEQSSEQVSKRNNYQQLYRLLHNALERYESNLHHRIGMHAREYLTERGLSQEIIKQFRLGFSPKNSGLIQDFLYMGFTKEQLLNSGIVKQNSDSREIYEFIRDRLTFPIINIYNKVVGFGSRLLNSEGYGPKYLNSPETELFKKSEILYGENIAFSEANKQNSIIIVEGYTDVLFMHQYGFSHTAASLGTAVTSAHLQRLWKNFDEIVLCMDGDHAGINAATRVIELALPLIKAGKKLSFITLKSGNDPDDVLKYYGSRGMQNYIDSRLSMSEYIWQYKYSQILGGKSKILPEDKSNLEKALFEYVGLISDNSYKYNIRQYFKDKLWDLNKKKRPFSGQRPKSVSKPSRPDSKVPREKSGAAFAPAIEANSSSDALFTSWGNDNASIAIFLEHCLVAETLHHPELLKDSEIEEKITRVSFNDANLAKFKDYLLESQDKLVAVSNSEGEDFENMQDHFKKAGFFDIFNLLSCENSKFYDKISRREDYKKSWLSIFYKYNLANLKQEYTENLKHNDAQSYEKAMAVLNEINELERFLEEFNQEEE
jgi:DNA primase